MAGASEQPLPTATASADSGPHQIRITSGGSISHYVKFSLSYLKVRSASPILAEVQENPLRPLVLHTLPAPLSTAISSPHLPPLHLPADPSDEVSAEAKMSEPEKTPPQTSLQPSLLTTPKLISVVEIIKREYLASLSGKGKHKATGLWQYTETGLLPSEFGEKMSLETVLSGKMK